MGVLDTVNFGAKIFEAKATMLDDAYPTALKIWMSPCLKMEKYAVEIEKVEEEHAELVNSIGSETESKAKDRYLSAFIEYMQSIGLAREEDIISSPQLGQFKRDGTKEVRFQGTLEEKKDKVLHILSIAVSSWYDEVKHRVLGIFF